MLKELRFKTDQAKSLQRHSSNGFCEHFDLYFILSTSFFFYYIVFYLCVIIRILYFFYLFQTRTM